MSWTVFIQIVFFVCLGAHIYSIGKAGASMMAPITNAFQFAAQAMSERREKREQKQQTITPQIRS